MRRVPEGELDYPGDDGLYYHGGEPFTGAAFRGGGAGMLSEEEYRDGMAWGACRSWHASGAPAGERQTVAGVWHGICQEWDERGRHTLYEVYELGICLWRRRYEAGELVEDWRLAESDADSATLAVLRKHYMLGLVELGSSGA